SGLPAHLLADETDRLRGRSPIRERRPMPARRDAQRTSIALQSRREKALRRALVALGSLCLLVGACGGTPTEPSALPAARYAGSGNGVCLLVAAAGCDLVAGCGHGQFPPPTVRADGTFDVDGTYRVEVGPISINPPPPAKFSGVLKGQTLTVTVTPSDP